MARIKSKMIKQMKQSKPVKDEDGKAASDDGAPAKVLKPPTKRVKRAKSHARALRKQMRKLQATPDPIVSKAAVDRVVRSIVDESVAGHRISAEAMRALHIAAEQHLHDVLSDAYALSVRVGKRPTLMPEELRLVSGIWNRCVDRYKSVLPMP